MVKTTVRLPYEVWLAARTRALARRVDLQDLVTMALRAYLKLGPAQKKEGTRP